MEIIGLGHYSRTGKDTFANAFIAEMLRIRPSIKCKKIPFAWKLKQICHELYGWAGVREPEFYDTPEGASHREDMLPIGMTVVQLWIKMGTDAIRNNIYDRTWIDYICEAEHDCDILLVPDCRFLNEVHAIRERGGYLIKMVRPMIFPRASRADTELYRWRGWDYVFAGDCVEGILNVAEAMAGMRAAGERLPSFRRAWNVRRRNDHAYAVEAHNDQHMSDLTRQAIEKFSVEPDA